MILVWLILVTLVLVGVAASWAHHRDLARPPRRTVGAPCRLSHWRLQLGFGSGSAGAPPGPGVADRLGGVGWYGWSPPVLIRLSQPILCRTRLRSSRGSGRSPLVLLAKD
jgi:hypothetical protein